jgi:fatty-acyl-CoA synthase
MRRRRTCARIRSPQKGARLDPSIHAARGDLAEPVRRSLFLFLHFGVDDVTESVPKGGLRRASNRVMNLAHTLRQNARRFPDLPGLVWGERRWSWAEIEREVDALASALTDRGLGKGDRLLVHSKNTAQMFFSLFAAFKLGAVWVPTNFRLMPDEVIYLAQFSGAKGFLCHGDFPAHAEAVRAHAPSVDFIWRLDEQTTGVRFGEADVSAMMDARRGARVAEAAVEHDDPCWYFFTSGTTGRSKAAVLTHGQMAFVMTNHLCDLLPGANERDASLVVAPLSHGAGVHQLNVAARGAPTILLPTEKFDVEEAWRLVEAHKVTNIFAVPTILKMLVEHPAVDRFDHSSLRAVIYAGAPMYREDQKFALKKLGKVITQYFGLGEVTGNITVLPPALHDAEDMANTKFGTCGFERTGMQVSIQDDAGRELQAFETGEICVIGPAVFAGYYDNPEANAKAFRDGWFRTGDLGHMDDQGFVYITGRSSDMYISGGSNIYPREIEEKILTHPAIAEAAVLGVPDPTWGEVGVAVCVARAPIEEATLAEFLAAKVPRYKMPKRFVFWEALPKSGYGKVPKRLVKDELLARGVIGEEGLL